MTHRGLRKGFGFLLAILGAIFISLVFASLSLSLLSFADLSAGGLEITSSVVFTSVFFVLMVTFFERTGVRMEIARKLSEKYVAAGVLVAVVVLFVMDMFFYGIVVLIMFVSVLVVAVRNFLAFQRNFKKKL